MKPSDKSSHFPRK